MNIIVMKFGGTSLATIEHIKNASRKVEKASKESKVIVVLSAMAGITNSLVEKIKKLNDENSPDSDLVLSTGEQISIGLMSTFLNKQGVKSRTWTAWQIPIVTNNSFGKARIENISSENIINSFADYDVAIVAGFQGTSLSSGGTAEITTLGRGGSDTSAVALATALNAEACEIYTDVPGVLTTDPRKVANAQLIPTLSCDEMLELASLGAAVLHPRAVELARNYGVTVKVRSSFLTPQ